ncbi:putative formaldehyde dehydrogenase [Talaromyces proteolyticus]|uniref:Formaldehyde dehydrogenase n=1 Tax=Talaromyces proteolyticus TaxID=1131652 RepID=A0AAD4Q4N8_9EURO|nr:putative formaldehyde dehydrogenase [Talaromyces proteolyticus]KAH8703205.1 putative formaldehyde dehydrogenase [Talaromyces proteolyticus]
MGTGVPPQACASQYKPHPTETMKAAVWMDPWNIEIRDVAKPVITEPADAIVQITHNTICGSDLHLYTGEPKDYTRKGMIMGHEAIGFVTEVGFDVNYLQIGDRVIILPIIACGKCQYCERKEFSFCDTTNPSKTMEKLYGHRLSGAFGYSDVMGGYPGDQAEYCRVPNADLTCVKVPADTEPKKLLALADVTTAAWHGCELAGVGEGDIVGVWGCGPVGLSIQRLALLRGASRVYAIDKDSQRLQIAEVYGMIPVDVTRHPNVSDYILSVQPHGLDCGIEASGFRSTNTSKHVAMRTMRMETDSGDTVHAVLKSTRKSGRVALIGDFFLGTNDFPIGMMMQKGITIRGDEFENIGKYYKMFSHHQIPGGLKVCLTTVHGRGMCS